VNNNERWEHRGRRLEDDFSRRPVWTVFKYLALLGLLGLGIAAVFGVIGWVGDWGSEGKRIVSPTNVREQHTLIIEDWEAMEAAASNACAAKDSKGDPGTDPSLLESPSFAYDAQYRRIRVDYNRRQKNLFEGKLVGPKGYPRNAPKLKEMQLEVC
jgi:hypothetical protein